MNDYQQIFRDRTILLRALLHGKARWEPFTGCTKQGEVCVGGFRWATILDKWGFPVLHDALRSELQKAARAANELVKL